MSIDILKEAEMISNALALPTIILSAAVVFLWFKPATDSLKEIKINKTTVSWFIIGVFLGFLGETIDNIYWTIAWTANYLELGIAPSLMSHGVLSNIPFRQILGIIAAYCHIRSALSYGKEEETESSKTIVNELLITSLVIGLIYTFILYVLKINM